MLVSIFTQGIGSAALVLSLGIAVGLYIVHTRASVPKTQATAIDGGNTVFFGKTAFAFEIFYYSVHIAVLALFLIYTFL